MSLLDEAQKLQQKTWRWQRVSLAAGVVYELHFQDTTPNHIIINNNSANVIYISASPSLSATSYDLTTKAYSRKIWGQPSGVKNFYLFATVASVVMIQSYEGLFDTKSIDSTQEITASAIAGLLGIVSVSEIVNMLPAGTNLIGKVTPEFPNATIQTVALAAGVDSVIKATPGIICAITTALADLIVKDGGVTKWSGGYGGVYPLNCVSDITLNSAGGGTANIAYI
jgi:hypothetical protein